MPWNETLKTCVRVRYRHNNLTYTDSTFTDPQMAAERLEIVEQSMGRRAALYDPGPAPMLRDWVKTWQPKHLVGRASAARDASLLRVHILPWFGRIRISAIDMLAVEVFAGHLLRTLKRSSVDTVLALLRKIIRDAVTMRIITDDPLSQLRLPAEVREEHPVLTQGQVWCLACRMPTQQLKVMVLSAAATGMRFGELAAVAPAAIQLRHGKAWVDPKVGSLHEVGGQRWLGPPKPPSGARVIHLPPYLSAAWAPLCTGAREAPIFTARHGGLLWRTTFVANVWRPACDGDPRRGWAPIWPGLKFKDLRSTHRTWMDEDQIAEVVMAKRMGHKLRDVRDNYATLTDRMAATLMHALQQRWEATGATC